MPKLARPTQVCRKAISFTDELVLFFAVTPLSAPGRGRPSDEYRTVLTQSSRRPRPLSFTDGQKVQDLASVFDTTSV